jgi:hypothetical protein
VISSCASPYSTTADSTCKAVVPDLTAGTTATDNCYVSKTQSIASGTFVTIGVTNISVTASDNFGNTATCYSTFTVTDITPPTIEECGPAVIVSADSTCHRLVPDFVATTSYEENCDIEAANQTIPVGTSKSLGMFNVSILILESR